MERSDYMPASRLKELAHAVDPKLQAEHDELAKLVEQPPASGSSRGVHANGGGVAPPLPEETLADQVAAACAELEEKKRLIAATPGLKPTPPDAREAIKRAAEARELLGHARHERRGWLAARHVASFWPHLGLEAPPASWGEATLQTVEVACTCER